VPTFRAAQAFLSSLYEVSFHFLTLPWLFDWCGRDAQLHDCFLQNSLQRGAIFAALFDFIKRLIIQ
jgi:hypothetical protein